MSRVPGVSAPTATAIALLVAFGACSFDSGGLPLVGGDGGGGGPDGPVFDGGANADARVDAGAVFDDGGAFDAPVFDAAVPDATPDATPPPDAQCTIGFLDICAQAPPDSPWDITTDVILDTDSDSRCRAYDQIGGTQACLILTEEFSIGATGSLTALGTRPLIIGSTTDIFIDGLLDVSSQTNQKTGAGANHGTCTHGDTPEDDLGGAGGGAGGSFGGAGGNGGTGDTDTSLGLNGNASPGTAGPTAPDPGFVRGGCHGQSGGDESGIGGDGGAGGDSGGAVHLLAFGSVVVSGTGAIRATGAGGGGGEVQAGGGGGGSGGYIGIDAADATIAGSLSANGGGGGEGGGRTQDGDLSGNPGTDGQLGAAPAPGGTGANAAFGDGGDGSASGTLGGGTGADSVVGAGGGGGGAGVVFLTGQVTVTGIVSPTPTINP